MVELKGKILTIDMDAIKVPKLQIREITIKRHKKYQEIKRLDPFALYLGGRPKKFKTPQELQEKVDGYFETCWGARYYNGKPLLDENGEVVKGIIRPYTMSGLARYLGISIKCLFEYEVHSKAGTMLPEYAEILTDAKLRIQEYAEQRLYDREGSSGARFVLETGFGWLTKKEAQELRQTDKRIKLAREKLEFVKEQAREGKLDDKELTVNILRAGDDN